MAVWKNVHGGTGGTLKGGIEYEGATGESFWQIEQDEKPFIEQAKLDRELQSQVNHTHHRKFATIPDIVAIEVMDKYGIDIHNPEHNSDYWTMKRFKQIIMQEFPHLVVNKA